MSKRLALRKRVDVTQCRRLFVRSNGAFALSHSLPSNDMAARSNVVRISKGDQSAPVVATFSAEDGRLVDRRESLTITFPDVYFYRDKIGSRVVWTSKQKGNRLKFSPCKTGIEGNCGLAISGPVDQIDRFLTDIGPSVEVHRAFTPLGQNGTYQMRTRKHDKKDRVVHDLPYSLAK